MPKMPIDPERYYKPSEIVKYGFMLSRWGNSSYLYVLRQINKGKIQAINKCQGKFGKAFEVKGSEIIKWQQEQNGNVYVPTEVAKSYQRYKD
jgi:hypothetical protein